jgi:hypothetical protein
VPWTQLYALIEPVPVKGSVWKFPQLFASENKASKLVIAALGSRNATCLRSSARNIRLVLTHRSSERRTQNGDG